MVFLEQMRKICRANPQTVVFAEANDARVIAAARQLQDSEIAVPILQGGTYEIRELASAAGISTRGLKIVNPNHTRELDKYLQHFRRINAQSAPSTLSSRLKDPLIQSIIRVRSGAADFAMGGNIEGVAAYVSAGLRYAKREAQNLRVSSFYLLLDPNSSAMYAFADCSINVEPTPWQLADIAYQTAVAFQQVAGRPARVAFLSFSTRGSASHENVEKVLQAKELFAHKNSDILFDGELQFDAAVDALVAQKKAGGSCLNGNTNVFIFPTLNAANIAQKIAVQMAGYTAIGPMITGFESPLHILPTSCSVQDVENATMLATLLKIHK